jgi:hypothetical protein
MEISGKHVRVPWSGILNRLGHTIPTAKRACFEGFFPLPWIKASLVFAAKAIFPANKRCGSPGIG